MLLVMEVWGQLFPGEGFVARVWSSFISLKTNLWVNHSAVVRSEYLQS